ncbi:PPC domain-containing protein [Phycisphaeraceae bacterium D3-23]
MTTRHLINALWAAAAAVPFTLAGQALAQPDADVGGNEGPEFQQLRVGGIVPADLTANDYTTPDGQHWDIYLVELTAGENYQFAVQAESFSASVGVYTEDGNPIQDCLYEADENSFTIQVETTGTYSVVVGSNEGPATGMYMIASQSGVTAPTQRPGQGGEQGNDNGRGNAGNGQIQEINVPRDAQQINANLSNEDIVTDEGKFFSFLSMDLQQGQTFHFMIESDGFPVMLNMQDNDGNFVQINGVGLDGRYFNVTAPADGNYSLLIVGLEPGQGGDYTVTAWQGEPVFAPEAGSDGPRPGNGSRTVIDDQLDNRDAELEDGSYFGYHYVELTAGVTYTIDVSAQGFDTQAYLFDPENNQLALNDNGPQMGTNSRIVYTPETTGEYSVGVSSVAAGRTGGYRVVVTSGDPMAQDLEDDVTEDIVEDVVEDADGPAVLLNVTGEASAEQSMVSADFHLEAGQTVVIETYGLSDGCDTTLHLYGSTNPERATPDDPLLAENDDDAGLLSSRIVFTAEQAGDYYVVAGVYEGGAGEFSLIVREALPARDEIVAEGVEIAKDDLVLLGDFEFEAGPQYIVIETLDLSNDCDTVIELRKTVDPERASEDDPIIATNDDFFSNMLLSRIYFQCEEPGLYYVVVRNIGKDAGTCTFRIRFEQ